MFVIRHVHSTRLILFNLHKDPAKPIAILHFTVAETDGKKSPVNRKGEATLQRFSQVNHVVVLQTPNNHEAVQFFSSLPVINVLCYVGSFVVAHAERSRRLEMASVLINECITSRDDSEGKDTPTERPTEGYCNVGPFG